MAGTAADYISANQLSVLGEHDQEFEVGRGLRLYMGTSGNADVWVTAVAYDTQDDKTIITVIPGSVQPTLTDIRRGATSGNSGGAHGHTGWGDGGPIPAALLSTTNLALLLSIAALVPDAGDVIRGTSASLWIAGPPRTIRPGIAGEVLSAYQVCCQDVTSDGVLLAADYNLSADEAEACVIVLADVSVGGTGSFLLHGLVENAEWTWTPGAILWLSEDGTMTETKPMAGYAVRLGRAWTATEVDFNPQPPEYMGGGTT